MLPLARHRTNIVFVLNTVFTAITILLVLILGRWMLIGLLASIAFNVWALTVSERQGFVRSNQIRRAYEPQRHFNSAQVIAVVLYIMLQIALGAYVLLAS